MSDTGTPPVVAPRTVLLLPHQDDETGVFPLLRARLGAGVRVSAAYTTRGTRAGADPGRRERESRRVLEGLGVRAEDVRFLGAELDLDDGAALGSTERLLEGLRAYLTPLGPVELVCPAWEGGHPDHDVTNLVARRLRAELGDVRAAWQFPLYHGAGLPGPLFRALDPLPANGPVRRVPSTLRERAADLARCLAYPSQWRSWLGLFPAFALRHLLGRVGALQDLPARLPEGPPHLGTPYLERRGFAHGADLLALLERWRGTGPAPVETRDPA